MQDSCLMDFVREGLVEPILRGAPSLPHPEGIFLPPPSRMTEAITRSQKVMVFSVQALLSGGQQDKLYYDLVSHSVTS